MDLNNIINPTRPRDIGPRAADDFRDPFENDYDRLIHSYHVRRLQDKTQVVPSIKADFVRTRLTHSHEVAAIGKSMGKAIGLNLFDGDLGKAMELAHLVEAACLVHDLGNPPFGHYGETVLSESTRRLFENNSKIKIGAEFRNELQNFDGNAQTIRILNNLQLQYPNFDKKGYNLTYATILTLLKYPCDYTFDKEKKYDRWYHKKIGYFYDDQKLVEDGCETLGLKKGIRHPATFILEAADDIAYSAADLEDGIRMGIVKFDDIRYAFAGVGSKYPGYVDVFGELNAYQGFVKDDALNLWASYFRVVCQKKMIVDSIERFVKNKVDILNGSFNQELIGEEGEFFEIRKAFKELAGKIFAHRPVLMGELKGGKAIAFLFDFFAQDLFSPKAKSAADANGLKQVLSRSKSYKLMSNTYKAVFEGSCERNWALADYYKVRLLQDYISGMTDTYCLELYAQLS